MVSALATVSEKSATEPKTSLLKCKRIKTISTFNVRTLNTINQLPELVSSAISLNIDIICIQEHRFYHADVDLKYHDVGKGWTFVTASAWKNSINSSIGGVGMLLSPFALKTLNSFEKIRPRMIIATFNGNPCTTVISCYSPTNVSVESEVTDFFEELSSLVRHVPKHHVLTIGGDMNAQVGLSHDHPFTFHETTNRNGEHLVDFIRENGLICLNTHFQKRNGKLWTHTNPNGTKGQLDYMLINKKWKNSVLNCEAYNSFEGVSSDHRIVSSKIRLSLRANKPLTNNSPRYDWSTLEDPNICNLYSVKVTNQYNALNNLIENPSPNILYENFINAHIDAAKEYIPLKPKIKRRVPWESDAIIEKRKQLKEAATRENSTPSRANTILRQEKQKELTNLYDEEQKKYIQSKIDTIQNTHANRQSAAAWQTVNEISGRKTSSKAKLKALSQEERLNKWKEHFQTLLGNITNVSDTPVERIVNYELNIKTENFNHEELKKALIKLKRRKAAGLDEIPSEVWKTGEFNDILLNFCNAVYNQQQIDKWTEGCILPFPKKGDLGLALNYRGITLTAIAAKIYNTMLLNRIQPQLENILRKNQNGFRKNRSTVGQILTVRRIIEGVRARKLNAVLLFVDFSKAFDSIHRGKMEEILHAYGLPRETVSAIMMLYKNTRAKVRSPDGDTDFFDILAGVLQGDTLAPFLFIICLDYILRTSIDKIKELGLTITKARSSRFSDTTITDADYADDLALMTNTITEAETLLHSLEKAAGDTGLFVNATKTEYICFNQPDGIIRTLNGQPLKSVKTFTYLGSNIESTEKDVNIRLGKAWSALDRLNVIWKSSLPEKMKREFFRAIVESVLVYGSSSWTLTIALQKKLDGNYTRMLRAILNISWKQHPTKQRLYDTIPPISDVIRERRTRFAGHCWRSKAELVSDVLLWTPTHGQTSVGRPAKTFIKQLSEDVGCLPEDLPNAMDDRDGWRERVSVIRASSTPR